MAPIRRYLRITKYSVLECRIYLDNPADASRWLLNPRDPALPRIIQSVKPLVLPKLREERERAKARGKKSKSVKDVVIEEDFEVAIYLTETSTRHSLLTKSKDFQAKPSTATARDDESPQVRRTTNPVLVRDESDDDSVDMNSIPTVGETLGITQGDPSTNNAPINVDEMIEDDDGDESALQPAMRLGGVHGGDDKKKLALNTTYDGFTIYGRILCLVVSRKTGRGKSSSSSNEASGQAMMGDWILSTQAPKEVEID